MRKSLFILIAYKTNRKLLVSLIVGFVGGLAPFDIYASIPVRIPSYLWTVYEESAAIIECQYLVKMADATATYHMGLTNILSVLSASALHVPQSKVTLGSLSNSEIYSNATNTLDRLQRSYEKGVADAISERSDRLVRLLMTLAKSARNAEVRARDNNNNLNAQEWARIAERLEAEVAIVRSGCWHGSRLSASGKESK